MNYKYTYESPLGTMIMLGTLSYLTDLFFIDEAYAPSYDDAEYIEQLTGPFEVTIMWLNQYFNGKKPFITPPIQLEGTEFRKSVFTSNRPKIWHIFCRQGLRGCARSVRMQGSYCIWISERIIKCIDSGLIRFHRMRWILILLECRIIRTGTEVFHFFWII